MAPRIVHTGGRWRHRLLPAKGGRYPSRVVCVDCDGALADHIPGARRYRESLSRWCAVATYYRAGRPFREVRSAGQTADQFWCWLAGRLSNKTKTWLVCSPSGRILALLGFWERLENGQVTLLRPDDGGNRPGVVGVSELRHVHAREDGQQEVPKVRQAKGDIPLSAIFDDPPTIAQCWLRGAPGSILIVDARNWGMDDATWGGKANDRAQAIAGFVAGQVSVLRTHQFGSLRPTAGSQALRSLRCHSPRSGIYVHNHSAALQLERLAYHGGRVECFRIGRVPGPCYLLDIKSCYPWAAANHDIPCVLSDHADGSGAAQLLARAGAHRCIADVSIETHEPDYPVLCTLRPDRPARPLHYWGDVPQTGLARMVAYPRGIYRTVLCGPELLDAMEAGRVTAVHRCAAYALGRPLAGFYATWRRLCDSPEVNGRNDLRGWLKRLGVALIGKFGETGRKWVYVGRRPQPQLYSSWTELDRTGRPTRCRAYAGHVYREVLSPESFDSCPGLAAWVCSIARVRLLEMLRCAGPGHVYMVLTDCLMVDAVGFGRLADGGYIKDGVWGYLKSSAPVDVAHVYGTNHYSFGGRLKCSGLPLGHAVDTGDGRSYRFLPSVPGQIRSGARPDAVAEYHEYRRNQPYLHGRVRADGWVEPWEFL